MPNMDDFHAFKSTIGSSGGGSLGCSGNMFTWILVIICILWVIGKLAG